jgi:pimeloyl-ACP methyl ester carboxylesterase
MSQPPDSVPEAARHPLRTLFDASPVALPGKPLLVMLPGALDVPEDFIREGFVAAVRERGLPLDILLVDAHVSHYSEQTVIAQLHEQVIEPARARGHERIWLAGISIGGMGSLMYAQQHPQGIEGVLAMAPYLGPRNLSVAIQRAGGLAAWPLDATTPEQEAEDSDLRLWRWLQGFARADVAATRPPLTWGYGTEDRFAIGHRVVAEVLPPGQVVALPGAHVWPVWQALWAEMLGRVSWPGAAQ